MSSLKMTRAAVVLLAIVVGVVGVVDAVKRYDNYQLLKLQPLSEQHIKVIQKLERNSEYKVDVIRRPNKPGDHVIVMVAPETLEIVLNIIKQMQPIVLNRDMQTLIDNERLMNEKEKLKLTGGDFPLDQYHRYQEILDWLDSMVAKYSGIVKMETIGKSFEGRELRVLTISSGGGGSKPGYWIDAGMHAREWISPATGLYIINELLTKANSTYADVLGAVDFYILPMVNPDGYEYTHLHDRMWRKTRGGPYCSESLVGKRCCYGTDPNRNWDFQWGVSGSSKDPCSEVFQGPKAFSEPECKIMADYVTGIKDKLKAVITLHSFSEDILYPYGYAVNTFPPDVDDLIAAGKEMAAATAAVHGTKYSVVNSAGGLYPASGASDDWSKNLGIKYVYTIELRPGHHDSDNDNFYGFELPAKFIMRTAEETWPGMLKLVDHIKNL